MLCEGVSGETLYGGQHSARDCRRYTASITIPRCFGHFSRRTAARNRYPSTLGRPPVTETRVRGLQEPFSLASFIAFKRPFTSNCSPVAPLSIRPIESAGSSQNVQEVHFIYFEWFFFPIFISSRFNFFIEIEIEIFR